MIVRLRSWKLSEDLRPHLSISHINNCIKTKSTYSMHVTKLLSNFYTYTILNSNLYYYIFFSFCTLFLVLILSIHTWIEFCYFYLWKICLFCNFYFYNTLNNNLLKKYVWIKTSELSEYLSSNVRISGENLWLAS